MSMHSIIIVISFPDYRELVQRCRGTMADFYQKQVDDRAWPPVKATNFINLALIKDQTTWRQTVQGSVDEIVGDKAETSYQSIIDSCIGTFILLQGRPGSGKTVLMNKISCDWAKGEILESSLVILIPLRRLGAEPDRKLATLLRVACRELQEKDIEMMVPYIEETQGEGVVFAFDGFDEYVPSSERNAEETSEEARKKPWYDSILRRKRSHHNDPESMELKPMGIEIILKRKYLTKSTVIVTSRPAACKDVRIYADKQIEVLGFLKEQIFDYIHHYFDINGDNKAQELEDHLKDHPNLMNMAYLPLHCAMLAFLYEDNTFLPETETEFYQHFTLSTLLRSTCKRQGQGCITKLASFDQLPHGKKIIFDEVCKLAFNATINSKQVFSSDDIEKVLKGTDSRRVRKDVSELGLIVTDQYFMRYGLDDTYTFLHLTFQEYLGAVYIAGLKKSKRNSIIKKYKDKERTLSVVWRFLCGMMDFSHADTMATFESIMKATKDKLEKFRYCFETQHILPCNHVLNTFNGRLEFSSINFTPFDCAAIGYTINESDFQSMIYLSFHECSFSSEGALSILQSIGDRPLSLTIRYENSEIIA